MNFIRISKTYLLIIFLSSTAVTNLYSATELLQEADKSFKSRDYSSALQYYKEMHDSFSSKSVLNNSNATLLPNYHLKAYACLRMGDCYQKLKDDDLAISAYTEGASANGNSSNSELEMRCQFEKSFLLIKVLLFMAIGS
jgi:hypothetical protein